MHQNHTDEQGHVLRVAAAQMESRNGEIEANLAHTTALVEEAARREAQLVVFPELMPTGYMLIQGLWEKLDQQMFCTYRRSHLRCKASIYSRIAGRSISGWIDDA